MRCIIASGLIASLALAAAGCTSNAQLWKRVELARARAGETAPTIAVLVQDWKGRPLSGVAVVASPGPRQIMSESDTKGWAFLTVPEPGEYDVVVFYGTTRASLPTRVDDEESVTTRVRLAPPVDLPATRAVDDAPRPKPLIELAAGGATPMTTPRAALDRLPR